MAKYVETGAGKCLAAVAVGEARFLIGPGAEELCARDREGERLIPVACESAAEQALLAEYIQTLAEGGMTAGHIRRAAGAYRRRTHVLEAGGAQGLDDAVRRLKELGYAGGRILIACRDDAAGALELMRLLRGAFGSVDVQLRTGEGEPEGLQMGVVC